VTAAQLPPAMLDDAFALSARSYIFLIGGGGKTTLMFTLARHLSNAGRTVLATTSTKILYPATEDAACVIVEEDLARAASRLRSEPAGGRHIAIGKTLNSADHKLNGYSADELDYLRQAKVADCLIVEADGAAGRSLKAHNDYEPLISSHAEMVIAVIGGDCIGCPLTNAHVHRAERFAELLNRPIGATVTEGDIAEIFFHPRGYLKSVPPQAEVRVLISKAGSHRTNAQRIAVTLHTADRHARISRIVIGELAGPRPFLEPAS
jgi:probable selenium-dependent hydroxylase accessory protein YqeC